MIDEKLAKALFGPFRGYPGEPPDESGIRVRYACLAGRARSEAHARRVMQHLIETLEYFPKVSEIVQACEYTPDDVAIVAVRNECQDCHGDGWRTVEGPYGTSAAYPCDHSGRGNPRIGVSLPPAVQKHYQQEQEPAAARKAAFLANPPKVRGPKVPPRVREAVRGEFKPISAEDIEREIERRRAAEAGLGITDADVAAFGEES